MMRRFWKGFLMGLIVGWLLVRLREEEAYLVEEMVPAGPLPVEEETLKDETPDDFVVLRGVGPAFAERLHQAGIRTFAQLARLAPEDVAASCGIPVGRVLRDDWIGQAAEQIN
jgi:predicted flap endonuclease-1-like 5' DNA nuclease